MKKFTLVLIITGLAVSAIANDGDSTVHYPLPDSVKAISFMTELNTSSLNKKSGFTASIRTGVVTLSVSTLKDKHIVDFYADKNSEMIVYGEEVGKEEDVFSHTSRFSYTSKRPAGNTYKLLVATASDSAENFSLYSGYIWFPNEEKWKFIGTLKIKDQWTSIQDPQSYAFRYKDDRPLPVVSQAWCQRNTGSWKNMLADESKPPVINLFGNTDSLTQLKKEIQQIENAIAAGATDVKENVENVYYKMIQEGSGSPVTINDTVTVHYKGYLFSNGAVFDQSKEKPATFPLKRLIRGWQIGIPLCRVGGKIKLVIPSALAYSVRTRAAKIPPNSILVFEIEVLDTKPGVK